MVLAFNAVNACEIAASGRSRQKNQIKASDEKDKNWVYTYLRRCPRTPR